MTKKRKKREIVWPNSRTNAYAFFTPVFFPKTAYELLIILSSTLSFMKFVKFRLELE